MWAILATMLTSVDVDVKADTMKTTITATVQVKTPCCALKYSWMLSWTYAVVWNREVKWTRASGINLGHSAHRSASHISWIFLSPTVMWRRLCMEQAAYLSLENATNIRQNLLMFFGNPYNWTVIRHVTQRPSSTVWSSHLVCATMVIRS